MNKETLLMESEDTILIKKEEYDKLCRQSLEYIRLNNRIEVQDFVIKVLTKNVENLKEEIVKLKKKH